MGVSLPAARAAPLVPFGADPFIICEIKRRSPSRGGIAPGRDAVEQARLYADHGVRSVSVLTEQDRFDGSLDDLRRVKEALPGLSVLRKDFLLDVEDVEVSWRAGADAVLLIASPAGQGKPAGDACGGAPPRDAGPGGVARRGRRREVPPLSPAPHRHQLPRPATFSVDLLDPVGSVPRVSWKRRAVFESGIRSAGRRPACALGWIRRRAGRGDRHEVTRGDPRSLRARWRSRPGEFWPRLWARRARGRPLVKICGITRAQRRGSRPRRRC